MQSLATSLVHLGQSFQITAYIRALFHYDGPEITCNKHLGHMYCLPTWIFELFPYWRLLQWVPISCAANSHFPVFPTFVSRSSCGYVLFLLGCVLPGSEGKLPVPPSSSSTVCISFLPESCKSLFLYILCFASCYLTSCHSSSSGYETQLLIFFKKKVKPTV